MKRLLVVVALVMGGVACKDSRSCACDGDPWNAIDESMSALQDALAAGDVAGVADSFTDDGLQSVFHETRESFAGNTGYYVGAKQYSLSGWTISFDDGETATAVAALFFRLVGPVREFSLVKVNNEWLIDGAVLTTADTGEAVEVEIEFGESSILFDSTLIADGNIALQIHNDTSVVHELNILTAPPDADMSLFFEHPEDAPPVPEGRSMPEGFDFIGGVNGIEPGATVTLLFLKTLPSARYVMFCNTETVPGQPHSKSGEYAEFTIT